MNMLATGARSCSKAVMSDLVLFILLTLTCIWKVRSDSTCDLSIRRSGIVNSWQSSFDDTDTCFYNRTKDREADVLGNKNSQHSYRFFHSHNKSHSDSGYHWFAVQLNESVLITSVTVKGREDEPRNDLRVGVYNRARDIEIWTSNSKRNIFSGDHCWSRNMSQQFRETQDNWTLCGVTKNRGENVAKSEKLKVNCTAKVWHLLLRRNVSHQTFPTDYMSFADLTLHTVEMNVTKPQVAAENSNFTVQCLLQCNGEEVSSDITTIYKMQICLPNGTCLQKNKIDIVSSQLQNSGRYSCKLGSLEKLTAVTILYAAANLSIHLEKNASCWSPSQITVKFASAKSDPPSVHSCSLQDGATNSSATISNLTLKSPPTTGAENFIVSIWAVDEAQLMHGLSSGFIECVAKQTLPDGIKFQNEHRVRAAWSCNNHSWKMIVPLLVFTNTCFLILIICCVIVWRHLTKTRSVRERVIMDVSAERGGSEAQALHPNVMATNFKPAGEASPMIEPECSYATVLPAGCQTADATVGQEQLQLRRFSDVSEITMYLEIVADG